MINSIKKSYIRDAVVDYLTTQLSPKDLSRFCALIMKHTSFYESWLVVRYLKKYQEAPYFILKSMGHDSDEALEALLGGTWTLEYENVQQEITDQFLRFIGVGSLTDSQIERFCNLMRRGKPLKWAYDIITELSEEQEQLMFEAIAEGSTPAKAWQNVTSSSKLERT